MLRLTGVTCLGLMLLAAPALAQNGSSGAEGRPQNQKLDQQDQHFLDHAAKDNQGEIRVALLAEKKAESPAVKAFARLMVDDHVAVESQLASVLNRLHSNVSNGVTHEDRQDMQKLEPLHGHAFDRQFMQAQIKDHHGDIQKFHQELQSTHDGSVRAFAVTTLPMLRQHLALAEAVDHSLGGGEKH
ncbi:MAG TPA: DUF4142 domain-containing protein [Acetobacteraceae bacterium]|nr:DUF4142 domain-containing protein [Acetobacteraceae bacterium]